MGSFAAGAMFFWAGVALVPVILHLLRRRRRRTVAWGAMRFLREAVHQRARRFQLWRWLLLLLRVSAVLLIATALARPLLGPALGPAVSGTPPGVLHVVVMDTSYSMAAVVAGHRRFDIAQAAAVEICRAAVAGDGFALVEMSDQPRMVIEGISYRPPQVIDQIESLEVGQGGARLPETMRLIARVLQDEGSPSQWRGSIEVTFLSDLQRVTWDAGFEEALAQIASERSVRYRVVDCSGGPTPTNLIAQGIRRDALAGGADSAGVPLVASVAHISGSEPIEGGRLQLVIDGAPSAATSLGLSPGQSRSVAWSARLAPGRHAVEARVVAPDAIELDNAARHVVAGLEQTSVALFGTRPIDTRYLELAAMPGGRGSIDARQFDWQDLTRTEMGRFDVWVLCDPPPLREDVERRIEAHLESGGGVVWWLGPQWQPGAGFASGQAQAAGLAESTAGAWKAIEVVDAEDASIDPLDYQSELIAPFEPFPGSGLLSLPVFRLWRLEMGDDWRVALAVRPEDSGAGGPYALVATDAGGSFDEGGGVRGRQVLVATPPGPGNAEDPWNAVIAWPVFVPLVQGMVQWAARDDEAETTFVVGQEISGRSLEEEFTGVLRDPEGQTVEARVIGRRGQWIHWSADAARVAGFYYWAERDSTEGVADSARSTRSGGGPVAAVNVDPAEGDLTPVESLDERLAVVMPEEVALDAEARGAAVPSAAEAGAEGASGADREVAWWWLLGAVAVLVAESALVRWMEGTF